VPATDVHVHEHVDENVNGGSSRAGVPGTDLHVPIADREHAQRQCKERVVALPRATEKSSRGYFL